MAHVGHTRLMDDALEGLGVGAFDERVYRLILELGTAVPSDLASRLDSSVPRVTRALVRLHDQGLIGRLAGTRLRYAALDPRTAVESLVRERMEGLQRIREAAAELAAVFEHRVSEAAAEVELVQGSQALGQSFIRLQQTAKTRVRTFDRPPYALTTTNPVEESAIRAGITYQAIYDPAALEWPGVLTDIQRLVGRGEEARVLASGLRMKLAIADDALAVMPLSLDLTDVRTAIIRPSTLLDGLIDYWKASWAAAVPLFAPNTRQDPLADGVVSGPLEIDEGRLLALLVSGSKDETIARQLGWSTRTMRRRMQSLLTSLNASNRFQAGVIAARRGLL